ncbi:hypothetical protein TNCV_4830071 [Trichonephila clavipes]|nr:hypothetical protein TNCV_4830071 [Trichonephila clavipes]
MGYEKVDFLFPILPKDLAGRYPLCMILKSSGQWMVPPEEEPLPGGYMELLAVKTGVFGVRLWCIVMRLWQKFELQLVLQ